jgi:putative DNA primase/helicase
MASSRKNNSQGPPHRTDVGNAELFAVLFRDQLRFDHAHQRWLIYRKHWWEPDSDGELMRRTKQAVRSRLKNSANIGEDERRKKEVEWALASESRSRLEAMAFLARSVKPLADDGSDWDTDRWLLGVANGVVDLRTATLRDGRPDERITLHTNIAFDTQSKCPRWDRFLTQVFDGNAELISYVHRAVGYSLTGQTSEQCFFCCHGDGANGKSTFLNAIRYVLGGYACNLPFSAF